MLNKEGYERDIAILNNWKETLSESEYFERLQEIYSDYGLDCNGKEK